MEDNDSPKSLNNTSEGSNEDIINTNLAKKKNKRKKIKKNKKFSHLFVNDIDKLKIPNNKKKYSITYNNSESPYYKFVGKTIFVFMDKYDNPLLIIGPQWPLFVCFFSAVNILYLIIIFKLWSKFGFKGKLVNQISYWAFNLSYSYTSLINPGYPRNNNGRKTGNPREEYYFCDECHFYVKRSTNASHCYDCGICIEEQDHHCPWTSHCVGKNNIITFYIFIVSTLFSLCYLPLAFCQFAK